jgi:pimeloyl-ACP methyl ester carboxylesterase
MIADRTADTEHNASYDRYRDTQSRVLARHGCPAASRYVHLEAPRLVAHVLEAGEGSPLLLLHGGGATAALWGPLLGSLYRSFRIYAPDRPGCGLSGPFDYQRVAFRQHAVDFMGSVLDALGLQRVTLVGNSMGGFFSLVFALAHPERVNRLVLIGAPTGLDRRLPAVLGLLATPGLNRLLYATLLRPTPKTIRDGLRQLGVKHIERLASEDIECAYRGWQLPGAVSSWLGMMERGVTPRAALRQELYLRDELEGLRVPTLFIWGDQDTSAPTSSGQAAAAVMPDARVEVIQDVGHYAWLDAPDRCSELIIGFASQDSPVAGNP